MESTNDTCALSRLRKYLSADLDRAKAELRLLAEEVWRRCETVQVIGKPVTVKIKFSDFTRAPAVALPPPLATIGEFFNALCGLLATVYPSKRPVRLPEFLLHD